MLSPHREEEEEEEEGEEPDSRLASHYSLCECLLTGTWDIHNPRTLRHVAHRKGGDSVRMVHKEIILNKKYSSSVFFINMKFNNICTPGHCQLYNDVGCERLRGNERAGGLCVCSYICKPSKKRAKCRVLYRIRLCSNSELRICFQPFCTSTHSLWWLCDSEASHTMLVHPTDTPPHYRSQPCPCLAWDSHKPECSLPPF